MFLHENYNYGAGHGGVCLQTLGFERWSQDNQKFKVVLDNLSLRPACANTNKQVSLSCLIPCLAAACIILYSGLPSILRPVSATEKDPILSSKHKFKKIMKGRNQNLDFFLYQKLIIPHGPNYF